MKALDADIDQLAKTPRLAGQPPLACRQLGTDVRRMRSALPTPDPALTTEIQEVLRHLSESSSACLAGDPFTSSIEERLSLPALGAVDGFLAANADGDSPPALPPQTAARAAFEEWGWTRHGFSLLFAVHKDDAALTGPQVAACGPLARDSAAFLAALPSPDAQLTALLRSALNGFVAAGNACVAGDMGAAIREEGSATGVLVKAEARELAIAGS